MVLTLSLTLPKRLSVFRSPKNFFKRGEQRKNAFDDEKVRDKLLKFLPSLIVSVKFGLIPFVINYSFTKEYGKCSARRT